MNRTIIPIACVLALKSAQMWNNGYVLSHFAFVKPETLRQQRKNEQRRKHCAKGAANPLRKSQRHTGYTSHRGQTKKVWIATIRNKGISGAL